MAIRPAIINSMVKAAEKASKRLVRDFGEIEQLQVSLKGPADFVQNATLAAERTIREELLLARPGYGFSMPDGEKIEGDGQHCFIIAPLDGVTNFLHGIPHFAISMALQRDKDLVASVVYNPISDELFWSERGLGSYLNSRRLRVSARRELGTALLATGMSFKLADHQLIMGNLMPQIHGIRRFGSPALDLANVAAGRCDGFFDYGLHPWNIAAGILLVREAGGFVSDHRSSSIDSTELLKRGDILASNDSLHTRLATLLNSSKQTKKLSVQEKLNAAKT
ncbi:MAG: inositol monophosphatase family protein [Candidatus Pacebacteria bacterium]|nr:inositol monophosphatase family protein [Candidatus Paceibacterota bacterium]